MKKEPVLSFCKAFWGMALPTPLGQLRDLDVLSWSSKQHDFSFLGLPQDIQRGHEKGVLAWVWQLEQVEVVALVLPGQPAKQKFLPKLDMGLEQRGCWGGHQLNFPPTA